MAAPAGGSAQGPAAADTSAAKSDRIVIDDNSDDGERVASAGRGKAAKDRKAKVPDSDAEDEDEDDEAAEATWKCANCKHRDEAQPLLVFLGDVMGRELRGASRVRVRMLWSSAPLTGARLVAVARTEPYRPKARKQALAAARRAAAAGKPASQTTAGDDDSAVYVARGGVRAQQHVLMHACRFEFNVHGESGMLLACVRVRASCPVVSR